MTSPTNPAPERCEPPEGLRDRDGWHWIGELLDDGEWHPTIARWHKPRWFTPWLHQKFLYPDGLASLGYRYLMPVPSPAEIEALASAATALDHFAWSMVSLPNAESRVYLQSLIDAQRAALAPFHAAKETKDGK